MLTLLAIAVLAQGDCARTRCGREQRMGGRSGKVVSVPWAFCDLLAAGDKSGNWGCINGDQTTTGTKVFAGINSPAATSGADTCLSPDYSTTVKASSKYFATGTLSPPAGAFSTCVLTRPTSTWEGAGVFGHGDSAAHYPYESLLSGANWTTYFEGGGTFNIAAASWPPLNNEPTLVCLTFSGGTATLYAAGHAAGSGGGVTIANQNGKYFLANDGFGAIVDGKFYGGFYTDKALSASDVGRIAQAANCNRVAWVGDSISANGSPNPPAVAQSSSGVPVASYAEASAKMATGTSPRNCELQFTFNNGDLMATKLVIECGINDIIAGTTGADLWTAYESWIDARLAAGITVVPVYLTPFKNYAGWDASKESEREAFNTLLGEWCVANPTARCIDTTAAQSSGGMGKDGAVTELAPDFDIGDGLHPSVAGRVRLATLVAAGW